jgi:hypothetical protein
MSNCQTCRHWERSIGVSDGEGVCRWGPPSPLRLGDEVVFYFPETLSIDRCNQHSPRATGSRNCQEGDDA